MLLVIASEHGFVGRLNERVFDWATQTVRADEWLVIGLERGAPQSRAV